MGNNKICIIGSGWYGCYVAEYLLDNYPNIIVTIIDKNHDIMSSSSIKNQNRLHIGFHYPRCSITRNKCKLYFDKFIEKYSEIVENIPNNYYIISNLSKIKYSDYINLYSTNDYNIISDDNINKLFMKIDSDDNVINTNEKYINFNKSYKYFKNKFQNTYSDRVKFIFNCNIDNIIDNNNNVIISSGNTQLIFEKVFNCTYNQLEVKHQNNISLKLPIIYEKCLSLIYKQNKDDMPFDCLTIMDGDFSSIFYYNIDSDNKKLYTLTNVSYTPLIKSNNFEDVQNYEDYDINYKIIHFEEEICKYFPKFKEYFQYNSYFESYKCKNISDDDSRDINVTINYNRNIMSVWCGKISFIFECDKYIDAFLLE
jgi:hypothetical protein